MTGPGKPVTTSGSLTLDVGKLVAAIVDGVTRGLLDAGVLAAPPLPPSGHLVDPPPATDPALPPPFPPRGTVRFSDDEGDNR